ncbi:MAG: hypothetical protein ABI723_01530 [Bacteroidia bacterium]
MKYNLLIILILLSTIVNAQHRNDIWCFGDSAGIDFSNINNPMPIHSAVKSRGSCVSICDANSNLLFYGYTRATLPGNTTLLKNRNDTIMLNGDNVVGRGWYMELVIIPMPGNSDQYYVFSAGVTSIYGLYYSVVDMLLDSGLGGVIQKNNQLLPDPANDGLIAVKHGNGRDWWVIHRNHVGSNNIFYKFLISPSGITGPFTQNIGSFTTSNLCKYVFNKAGNKIAVVSYDGLIETFDFDRCTGILSNHILIRPLNVSAPYPDLWSCAFSPNNRFLYVTAHPVKNYLLQIDLQDSTPWANVDTLWSDSTIQYSAGALKWRPMIKFILQLIGMMG